MTARERDAAAGEDQTVDGAAVVFRVADVGYRWEDVFAHARRRGAWRRLETEVREALACQRMVVEEGLPWAVEEERTAARAFRSARRLYAAEDLEAWLAARGLTVAQWREYVRGTVLRRRHERDLSAVVARYPPGDGNVEGTVAVWGLCSGAFAAWARELAARAAGAHAQWERQPDGRQPPGCREEDRTDALWTRFIHTSANPSRLRSLVSAHHLDWLRVDWEQAVLPTRDGAREARACVRDDGCALAEAAEAAGTHLQTQSALLEQVDDGLRHEFVRCGEGDVVGPLQRREGWMVLHVRGKTPPSLQDPDVRARAVTEAVDTAVAGEVADRVRWLLPV